MDLPWDPDETALPPRGHLPVIPDALEEAAWVWGKDDAVCNCTELLERRLIRVNSAWSIQPIDAKAHS